MRFPLRPLILSAFAALCALPCAHAWTGRIEMEPDAGVDINVGFAYSESFPAAGCVPCRVSIKNESGAAHSWSFEFVTRSGSNSHPSEMSMDRTFTVPAGESATFNVLVPVAPSNRNDGYVPSPTITVNGYGVRRSTISASTTSRGGRNETVFVAMSPALALRSLKVLRSDLDKRLKLALVGAEVDLSMLSEDWRGLLGVGAFFISTGEYTALSPAQRHAIRAWVSQGGNLILCGDAVVSDFGDAGVERGSFGLGEVRHAAWDGSSELPMESTGDIIRGMSDSLGDRLKESSPMWRFSEVLGEPSRNVAFLAVFITLFAVAVGPLNLFWFAGSGKRHRLFWTTPLISVGASVLLGVVILAQDGFGGSGARMTLRYIFPGEKQVLVMQEQASRTGLLLSRGFAVDPDVFLTPLTTPSSIGGRQVMRNFTENRHGYGGDWFLSRSVQGQFLEEIAPSLETVEVVRVENGTPVVRSSIPVELEEFYYIDEKGGRWGGQNIRTGESAKLVAVDDSTNLVTEVSKGAGPMLRGVFGKIEDRNGHFYATAAKPACIDTLPSIRWTKEQTIYAGAVVPAP